MEYVWPSLLWLLMQETPKKLFLSEIFRGLSLDHFGQHVPESPVSQLINGVHQNLLYLLSCKLSMVLNGQFHNRGTMGRNTSETKVAVNDNSRVRLQADNFEIV